jgi:hypothetical protein
MAAIDPVGDARWLITAAAHDANDAGRLLGAMPLQLDPGEAVAGKQRRQPLDAPPPAHLVAAHARQVDAAARSCAPAGAHMSCTVAGRNR